MPFTDNFEFPRMRAYIRRALSLSGYRSEEHASLLQGIIETLRRVAAEKADKKLVERIEEKLTKPDPSKNCEDLAILRMAIHSMTEPRTRWKREGLESLGDEKHLPPSREENPLQRLVRAELWDQVRQQLDRLTPDQRRLLKSKYWDQMAEAEIGRQTGKDRRRVNEASKAALVILAQHLQSVLADYEQ